MTPTTEVDASTLQLTALARRVDAEQTPLGKLQALHDLDNALKQVLPRVVALARAEGASNADVGRSLGVSRQAIAKRFPRKPTRTTGDGPNANPDTADDHRGPQVVPSHPVFELTTPRGRVIAQIHRLSRSRE